MKKIQRVRNSMAPTCCSRLASESWRNKFLGKCELTYLHKIVILQKSKRSWGLKLLRQIIHMFVLRIPKFQHQGSDLKIKITHWIWGIYSPRVKLTKFAATNLKIFSPLTHSIVHVQSEGTAHKIWMIIILNLLASYWYKKGLKIPTSELQIKTR